MSERIADRVTVPEVVGLPFHVGRDLASEAGVSLANPDPDGPPISALAWPGLYYIVSQHPPAGTELYRWDSVAVRVVTHGDAPLGAYDPRPVAPLPSEDAHARPIRERYVDLTEDDAR